MRFKSKKTGINFLCDTIILPQYYNFEREAGYKTDFENRLFVVLSDRRTGLCPAFRRLFALLTERFFLRFLLMSSDKKNAPTKQTVRAFFLVISERFERSTHSLEELLFHFCRFLHFFADGCL